MCSTKPKLKRKSEVIDSEDGQNKSEGKPVNKKKKRVIIYYLITSYIQFLVGL